MADRSVTVKYRAEVSDYIAKTKAMEKETSAFTRQMQAAAQQSLTARAADLGAASAARTAATAQTQAADAAKRARTAELEAAEATRLAADAAEKLENGQIKAAEAQRLSADAAKKDEKAQLLNAEANRLAADAAERVERAAIKAAAAQLAQAKAAKAGGVDAGSLIKSGKSLVKTGEEAGESFESGFADVVKDLGGSGGPLVLVAAGAFVGAIPFIATAVGTAISLGIGAAGIGAGIAGQINNPTVRSAWRILANDARTELSDVTSSFAAPLERAATKFDQTLARNSGNLKNTFDELAPSVDHIVDGIDSAIDSVLRVGPAVGRNVAPLLDELGDDLPMLGDAVGDFLQDVTQNSGDATSSVRILIGAVAGGIRLLGTLIKYSENLVGNLASNLEDFVRVAASIPGPFQKEWQKVDNGLRGVADSGHFAAGGVTDLGQSAGFGQTEAGKLADQLDRATQELDGLIDATTEYSDSTAAFKKDLRDFQAQLKANGGSFDANTDAGYDNITMLDRLIQGAGRARDAQINQAKVTGGDVPAATRKADAAFDSYISQLYASVKAAGGNTSSLEQMIRTIYKIPKSTKFTITPVGINNARAAVDALNQAIKDIHNKDVYIRTHTSGPSGDAGVIGSLFHANGAVYPHMYAAGGFEDHQAQIAERGTPARVWNEGEPNGEAYIPLAESKRERSLAILGETGRRMGVQMIPMGAAPAPVTAAGSTAGPLTIENHIEVGGEVVRVVRTEIKQNARALRRGVTSGAGSR